MVEADEDEVGSGDQEDVDAELQAESSEDEESSDDAEVSSDEEDDSEIDQAFRDQLAAALQVDAGNIDVPDSSNSGSESDESMDDEQMLAIDEQLTEVFKSRMSDRQSKKREYTECLSELS